MQLKVSVEENIVSFYLIVLFTRVTAPLTVGATRNALKRDKDLSDRTSLSVEELYRLLVKALCRLLSCTCFSFEGEYFR